ncbi:MAG TPA: SWIM zinc finger family protein [Gemmataceae bacterium]|nr:SWIM zinc finger family protein [Gemmataceae bacterium]
MGRWDFYDRYFPPSRPRTAKGGIRAQSKRGGFGESWWAKRWITVLESFNIGARLQRGRRYARDGQVLSIEIEKGRITARVQGSRPKPYEIAIKVKALSATVWKKVADSVAGQAVFASKLLGGEMPHEMEEVLRAAGVSLFPERYNDLTTDCSCPDWSNPCKHIAAVYYLLGEEFDRDPFLIFRMRGMDREEFMTLIGERGPARRPDALSPPPEPLPAAPGRFWKVGALPDDIAGEAPDLRGAPLAGAAVARRLGRFPFWRGSGTLQDFLEGAYNAAATKAAEMIEGK